MKDTAETKPKICHSDNPTGQNPDLKAKITSKIESKNVFAFLKLFRFRVHCPGPPGVDSAPVGLDVPGSLIDVGVEGGAMII